MANYTQCPTCGHEPRGGVLGGAFILLHRCKDKGHVFCDKCKNGDRCPLCRTEKVTWKADKAYVKH